MQPNPFRIIGQEDYSDPKKWAEAATAALNTENLTEPMKRAFEAFKLDPVNPRQRVKI
jgi:hypothetical protein